MKYLQPVDLRLLVTLEYTKQVILPIVSIYPIMIMIIIINNSTP